MGVAAIPMHFRSPDAKELIERFPSEVRVEACVDRALEEISHSVDLMGRVRIGTLPVLCCDAVALTGALELVLGELLSDAQSRIDIVWESIQGDQVLVCRGPVCDPRPLERADALLATAGGRAWLELHPRDQTARYCLCPIASPSGFDRDMGRPLPSPPRG